MKKKVLATLSIIMVLSLTACSGDATPSNTPVSDSQAEAVEETDNDVPDTIEALDEEDESSQSRVAGYRDSEDIYINDFFEIMFTPSEGYGYFHGRVKETNGDESDFDEESFNEMLDSGDNVIEFIVADEWMRNSATVSLSKMKDRTLTMDDMDSIIDKSVPQLAALYEEYEDLVCERSSVTYLGEETPCIRVYGDLDGSEMNTVMLYMIKDGYLLQIGIQADTEEEISLLLSCFSRI